MRTSAQVPLGHSSPRYRAFLFIVVLMLAGGSATATTEDVGRCLSAEIPEPIVMPDGKVFPASRMTICYRRAYSPVMGMQEISIGEEGLGMYMSRSSKGPRPEGTFLENPRFANLPYLVFMRNSRDELVLHSYHRPLGDSVQHHVFAAGGSPRVTSHWRTTASNLDRGDTANRPDREGRDFDLADAIKQDNTVVLFAAAR